MEQRHATRVSDRSEIAFLIHPDHGWCIGRWPADSIADNLDLLLTNFTLGLGLTIACLAALEGFCRRNWLHNTQIDGLDWVFRAIRCNREASARSNFGSGYLQGMTGV